MLESTPQPPRGLTAPGKGPMFRSGPIYTMMNRHSPPAGKPPQGMNMQSKVVHYLLATLALLLLLPLGWAWLSLSWSYSEGERAGYVQKFSKKGWLCKTWEGEIALVTMPGAIPEKFEFSVRDDAVAEKINRLSGERVVLHYEQHKFIPTSCFGETEYFIVGVRKVGETQTELPPPDVPQGELQTPR